MTDPNPAEPAAAPQGPFKSRTGNRVFKWISGAIAVAAVIVAVLTFAGNMLENGQLPECDSDRARDTLSDVFQANSIEATGYDKISTEKSGEEETTCTAVLSLKGGDKLDVGYRFFFKDKKPSYEITTWNRRPA